MKQWKKFASFCGQTLENRQLLLVCSVGFAQPTRYTGTKRCFVKPLFRRRRMANELSFYRNCCVLLLLLFTSTAFAQLPASVAKALADAGIPESAIGVVVQPLDAAKPTIFVGGNTALNPASNMKLLTTFAALELLGPAYTWQTETWAVATPKNGVLEGDLYIKGGGDPKLTCEQFWRLLRQTRDAGISEIRGDVIQDRSAFAVEAVAPGEFDGQPLRPQNAAPDALLLNFNAIMLKLSPDANSVALSAQPLPANLALDNRLQLDRRATECGDWRKALSAEISTYGKLTRLLLSGKYAAICNTQEWNITPLRGANFVAGVFETLWLEIGGKFASSVRSIREGVVPDDAHRIALQNSLTLGEIVRDINKFSNNVMARQLLISLGASKTKVGASAADGQAVVRAWLAGRGLNFPELVIENGSGLSRTERISAAHLVQLLQSAWGSAVMPELMASLPLIAVDGTMKKRLKDKSIAGQAHIKTGSLDGVKTMAGYVLDKNGRRWALAFLVNHPSAAQSAAAQDALLEWVHAGGAAP